MIERIFQRYNPEHDTAPDGPPVTWAEHDLAIEVVKLMTIVKDLERKIAELENEHYDRY